MDGPHDFKQFVLGERFLGFFAVTGKGSGCLENGSINVREERVFVIQPDDHIAAQVVDVDKLFSRATVNR